MESWRTAGGSLRVHGQSFVFRRLDVHGKAQACADMHARARAPEHSITLMTQ